MARARRAQARHSRGLAAPSSQERGPERRNGRVCETASLHHTLRDFALEAAALLEEELRAGAEIEFEVDEQPAGSKTVLYRYTPLTSKFIDARWDALRSLPSCPAASRALGTGAALYLRLQGVPGVDAEPALRELLDRLYEDATSFEFPEERFEKVYGDVERTLYEDSAPQRLCSRRCRASSWSTAAWIWVRACRSWAARRSTLRRTRCGQTRASERASRTCSWCSSATSAPTCRCPSPRRASASAAC